MTHKLYDTVIVGSGPAGLTAAIYNIRANLKTVVVSGDQTGGQLTITTLVENFPGFVNGIGGPKLMMDMINQVKGLGGEILNNQVVKIRKRDKQVGFAQVFEIRLKDGKVLESKAVIVATGARARWLNIVGEKELMGRGVSGCATCDGLFFKDKRVAIVGGGDVACTEACFLTKFASKVFLIHRRDELRASQAEQKRVLSNPKMEILWNSEALEVLGDEKVDKVRLLNNKTGKERMLAIDGFFVAIGHDPATSFVKDVVELKDSKHIVIAKNREYQTMTTCPGIFAAGDCVDDKYRQAIIAAGDGCRAGMDAEKWIENQRL